MRKLVLKIILIISSISSFNVFAVTIVYNMRVATTTAARKELYDKLNMRSLPHTLVGTWVNQFRTRRDDISQRVNSGLVNYIYSHKNFYARLDSAVGNVHEKGKERTTSHTQMDDLLFSTGYRHTLSRKLNFAYSFLFGIPTHKNHGLEYFQFGTGHFSVGVQWDGIYSFGQHDTSSLISAVRFIHFFKAEAPVRTATRRFCVDLDLGDVVDLLLAYRYRWNKHTLEAGYNPGFAFGVSASPSLGEALPDTGIRSSWYSAYRYIFIAKKHPMGVGGGLSYSFDHLPKDVGLDRSITVWGSYGINF